MANPKLNVGDLAPDFALRSDDRDDAIRLHDLRGAPVIVYFYPKDSTPGCTTEACDFRDQISDFNDAGITVLGISPDSLKSHAKFREKHELNFPLLSDEEHRVAEEWGVWRTKKMYGREFEGIVRSTFLIDAEGRIAALWDKVRVKGHITKVLEAVADLND